MDAKFSRASGVALLCGSLLMVITMVLHPAGGSIAYLMKASTIIMVAHSIAILAMPVTLFGCWGLTARLKSESSLSLLAFSFMAFGVFAGLCAAALNGLAAPIFIANYKGAPPEVLESLRPFLRYNFALNHAFDYIFIVGVCVAIALWSIAIAVKGVFAKWIGYYGLLLIAFSVVLLFFGSITSLFGFRIFIFGIVSWIVVVGYSLMKKTV